MNDSDIANQSLKIYLPLVRCGEVRLTIDALEVLERVYNAFLRWDKLVAQADGDARDGVHYRGTPRRRLRGDFDIAEEEQLCLARIEVTAPAYFEIVGFPNPLNRLQKHLSARPIDWQRQTKEPDENRRLALEQQRIDLVRSDVELLRGLNYPETQIREALADYVFTPLDRLDRFHGLTLYTEEPSANTF